MNTRLRRSGIAAVALSATVHVIDTPLLPAS